MSFYVKIDENKVFELPTDIDVQERIELCQQIIDNNLEYFETRLPKKVSDKVVVCKANSRLEVMANYILNAIPIKEDDGKRLSDYKIKRNKYKEVPFSALEYSKDR